MSALVIHDNIPQDVIDNVQRFLDRVSEADNSGGIDKYILACTVRDGLHMCGLAPVSLCDSIIHAFAINAAMKNVLADNPRLADLLGRLGEGVVRPPMGIWGADYFSNLWNAIRGRGVQ